MFTRSAFLEALETVTSIDRIDLWAILGYLAMIGPVKRRALRMVFWPSHFGIDARLHWLVQHHAVELTPDKWGGDPIVAIAPAAVEIIQGANRLKNAERPASPTS